MMLQDYRSVGEDCHAVFGMDEHKTKKKNENKTEEKWIEMVEKAVNVYKLLPFRHQPLVN